MIAKATAVLAACAALMGGGGCAHAPQGGGELARLEDIFWTCDYLATTRGMDATPVAECAAATRELRRVKFDNSFNRMLEWWRANKEAEHGRRRTQRGDPKI